MIALPTITDVLHQEECDMSKFKRLRKDTVQQVEIPSDDTLEVIYYTSEKTKYIAL